MFTYTYSIVNDFNNRINSSEFFNIIKKNSILKSADPIRVDTSGDSVFIVFTSALNSTEEGELDSVILNYDANAAPGRTGVVDPNILQQNKVSGEIIANTTNTIVPSILLDLDGYALQTSLDSEILRINSSEAQLTQVQNELDSYVASSLLGSNNGIATLDGSGKIPSGQIPASAIPQVFVVADDAERLALTVQEGDEAIQTDDGYQFIFDGSVWIQRPLPNGGDVFGPNGVTDFAVVRFDGTSGKVIQNSQVTIDDSGNIFTPGSVDGRDISADGTKLDGIESGATADQAITAGTGLTGGGTGDVTLNVNFGTTSGTATQGNDSRIPSQDENNALQGTNGTPSNSNRYVTNSDPRIPTQGENDALQGTNGTPSGSNRYVTNSDSRLTNARTPTAHASTHITGGSDEIDGDRIDIDFNPTNYTPTTSPSEANNVDNLSAHLAGIDNRVANATTTSAGVVELAGDGENSSGVVVQGNDSRLSDNRDPNTHASTHIAGGSDEIDADRLEITFDPNNYSPDDSISEASSADELAAHLKGIDDRVGDATTTSEGVVRFATNTQVSNGLAVQAGDSRLPTQNENDALQGTSGSPSNSNKYVTNSDSRLTDSRTPTAHASTHEQGGSDELTVQDLGSGSATAGQIIETDGSGGWTLINTPSGGGGSPSELATIQLRRSTDFALPVGSFSDLSFNIVDLENNTSILERDDTNTDRILVKETGLYLITYNISVDDEAEVRVRVNDNTVLPGSVKIYGNVSDAIDLRGFVSASFFANLTNGDFLSLQVGANSTSENVITADSTANIFTVTRLQGLKGEPGPTGSGSSILVKDEDGYISGAPSNVLNFIGDGVVANANGNEAKISIRKNSKLKVSDTDTEDGYLSQKIHSGEGVITSIVGGTDGIVPVVQYLFNEASSGTTPTVLNDNADNPLDMAITDYDGAQWGSDGVGRFLGTSDDDVTTLIEVDIDGTKLDTALDGGTKATYEITLDVNLTKSGGFSRYIHIGNGGQNGVLTLGSNGNNNFSVYINDVLRGNFVTNAVSQGGTNTYHMVVDTTLSNSVDRVKLYKNGARLTNLVTGASEVPQNTTFNIANNDAFTFFNTEGSGDQSFDGSIYYAAVYDDVMEEEQITNNANKLNSDSDADPNEGSGSSSQQLKIEPIFGGNFAYTQDESVSITTSTAFQQKITLSVSNLPSGTYRLGWSYFWNTNTTSDDFEARIQQNNTDTLFTHVQEPKDSAGNFSGTGSNQRHQAAGCRYLSLSGSHDFDLDWRTNDGDEASIWNAVLEFWRVS